jgi:energy-converting hydrogenase Eha subunit A
MATWARVEASLFIIVSFFYIVCFEREKRFEKAIIFLTPIVVVSMISISGLVLFGISVNSFHRVQQIVGNLSGLLSRYGTLRNELTQLAGQYQDGVLKYFLPEARTNLWLVAFGTLLNRTLEAFFYPLFLIFAVGLGGTWKRIRNDRRLLYLVLLAISGLILLYLHTVHTWALYYRNMAIVIFPSFIYAGYGLERIVNYLRSRFRLQESTALAALCLMILASSLPKNLQTRAIDKHVFKEIGYTLAAKEGNSQEIKVATSLYTVKWLSFYANLDYLGAPCPQPYDDFKAVVGDSYDEFVRNLRENGIKYFLWEEKNWPSNLYDFITVNRVDDFVELGRWRHPDTGMMVLFEVL